MERCTHKINATLENRQVDHQSAMVEIECMINKKYVSILIDPGVSLSYVSPTIVEDYKLNKVKHKKSWLVQLATGMKRKVGELVKECIITMGGMDTKVDLNILPLGSYDLLIGMDWLEKHSVILNYWDNIFYYLDESDQGRTIKGIPRGVLVRDISSLQLKINARKVFEIYVVDIFESKGEVVKNLLTSDPIIARVSGCISGRNSRITSYTSHIIYHRFSTQDYLLYGT